MLGKKGKLIKKILKARKKKNSSYFARDVEDPNGSINESDDELLRNGQFDSPSRAGSKSDESSHESDSISEGEYRSFEVENLRAKVATQDKEIKLLKRKLVTKEMLENGLQKVHREISRNREDREQLHQGPLNHPPLNDNGEVQVTTDFSMPFKEYLYTLNAPDMRKRAIRVMSVLWTEERREKLLVEADPKRPDLEIVTEGEYQKIIQICLTFQQIKLLECRQQDDVISNIRSWTSSWLKNWKPKKRDARRLRNNPRL
ncbi:uncharacterized protein LOC123262284 [Cotesia glomerata]|nr:uncharacterized protein LOC123262284 [Cotesia glomerata]